VKRTRSRAPWWAAAAALWLLGASITVAPAAGGAEAPPHCYDTDWKPPCTIGLDCTPADPYDDDPCDFALPRDCTKIEALDCGDMPNRVGLDGCLAAKRICSRAGQIGEGAPIAVYEYVDDYDFVNGPLGMLPGDLACQGLLSPEADRWCSHVETVYPEASFLETSVWKGRGWLEGADEREPFARIGVEPRPECRMREGELLGRIEVSAAEFACSPDAPLPGPNAESLRLSDVAFSDTNHDLYLDAVVTVAWTGGGSGSTTMTATLTRLEPGGPLLHVRQLGPGFDCAKAGTPTEKRICADPKLAVLDLRLSRLYGHLLEGAKLDGDAMRGTTLRDEQRRFLKRRNAACEAPDAGDCMALYRARITELQRLAERAASEPAAGEERRWSTRIGSLTIGSGDETATFSDVSSTCDAPRLVLAFGTAVADLRRCLPGDERRHIRLEVENGRATSWTADPDDDAGRCVTTALRSAHLGGLTCAIEAIASR